jgi:hypothetical protein
LCLWRKYFAAALRVLPVSAGPCRRSVQFFPLTDLFWDVIPISFWFAPLASPQQE